MNRIVRRRREMAVRVRDFSRAHPSTDANYAAVLGQVFGGLATQLEEVKARGTIAIRRDLLVREHRLNERQSVWPDL